MMMLEGKVLAWQELTSGKMKYNIIIIKENKKEKKKKKKDNYIYIYSCYGQRLQGNIYPSILSTLSCGVLGRTINEICNYDDLNHPM